MFVVYQTPGYVMFEDWLYVLVQKVFDEVYSKVVNVFLCCYSLSLNNEMLVPSWP